MKIKEDEIIGCWNLSAMKRITEKLKDEEVD